MEPALKVEVSTNLNNYTRLYFGDKVEISFTIKHDTDTSTEDAKNVNVVLIYKHLTPVADFTTGNDTWLTINKAGADALPKPTLGTAAGEV